MIDRDSTIPLYMQLAELIRNQIRSGEIQVGDKLPSESEMIKKYHLGRLTIRDSLSILVNEGLIEKHHGKGTFCKSNGVSQKHKIDVSLNMSDISFTPYFLRSICDVLDSQNVDILLSDTQDNMDTICSVLEKALAESSNGIIFQPTSDCDIASDRMVSLLKQLENANIPYIMIDAYYKNVPSSYIVMNEISAGKMAAEYFLSLGHTDLCMIEQSTNTDSLLRMEGFEKACPVPPCRIEYDSNLEGSIKELINSDKNVTGIFCYNDGVAKKCYEILNKLKISIPDDISIISIDDTIIASTLFPTLTSIVHPKEYMGRAAAEAMISILKGDSTWPYMKVFEPVLAVRKSCKQL